MKNLTEYLIESNNSDKPIKTTGKQSIKVGADTKVLEIQLKEIEKILGEAKVKVKKQRYSKKDNPA